MSAIITKGTTPIEKIDNGEVNFIKIENIDSSSGEIRISQTISLREHEGYLKRSQLKKDDLLFSIAGTLGRVTAVKPCVLPANTNQALAIIRIKCADINYVKTYLKGKVVKEFIKENPTVGAQPNLSLLQVKSIDIKLPSQSEQKKIGELFEKLDDLITLHQRLYFRLKFWFFNFIL